MKKPSNKILFCLIFCCYCLCHVAGFLGKALAQEEETADKLKRQIVTAKAGEELYYPFAKLKEFYFKQGRYADFITYLDSLGRKKKFFEPFINYYTGLSHYEHLKELEEKQLWEEYFNRGDFYRNEVFTNAQKAIAKTKPQEAIHAYALLLVWQLHKDQQDILAEDALINLTEAVIEYSKGAKDALPIKEIADKLSFYKENVKAGQFYGLYSEKIISSALSSEELSVFASEFYKEGNLAIAENIYDAYVERIIREMPNEKALPLLKEVAKLFAYKDSGGNDMLYAEKIFAKIEDAYGKESLDQEFIYLRAFNLEKGKDFGKAKDSYIELVRLYPQAASIGEAEYKIGIIYTYLGRDIKTGREYFNRLAQKEQNISPHVISAFYQLGLLSQWEGDAEKAKGFYNKLIALAKDSYQETAGMAKQRLEEIESGQPIEYNLKTFLDVCLKEEYRDSAAAGVELKPFPYMGKKDESVLVDSVVQTAPTGCLQIQLQYLWSGHLGSQQTEMNQPSLKTSYLHPGTKEVNLVVMSASGIIEHALDLIDIY